jgi:hypothetical protein|nr:MAG TPA: hypothetical protein [Caudoviricetes sp.]
MELDDSLDLIKEVLNNRTENRAYNYYLNTLIFSLFSKEKPQTYSEFKNKLLHPANIKKSNNQNKLSEEEKKNIKDKNKEILERFKKGEFKQQDVKVGE